MKPLALVGQAARAAGTTYTWVPREQNKYADRLVNDALDGKRLGVSVSERRRPRSWSTCPRPGQRSRRTGHVARLGGPDADHTLVRATGSPTTPPRKRFSGGLASTNPGPQRGGPGQVRATALVAGAGRRRVDAAGRLAGTPHAGVRGDHRRGARPSTVEPRNGFAEMEFGAWDGLTFAEVREQHQDDLRPLARLPRPRAGRWRVVPRRRGAGAGCAATGCSRRTPARPCCVVSHVTPIKTLVAHALGAPLESLYRMELSPASVTVLSYYDGGPGGDPRGVDAALQRAADSRPPSSEAVP